MNEAPHCDWRLGAASDTMLGTSWVRMLKAALTQSEQITSLLLMLGGIVLLESRPITFWMLRGCPVAVSIFVRSSVRQIVLPLNFGTVQ